MNRGRDAIAISAEIIERGHKSARVINRLRTLPLPLTYLRYDRRNRVRIPITRDRVARQPFPVPVDALQDSEKSAILPRNNRSLSCQCSRYRWSLPCCYIYNISQFMLCLYADAAAWRSKRKRDVRYGARVPFVSQDLSNIGENLIANLSRIYLALMRIDLIASTMQRHENKLVARSMVILLLMPLFVRWSSRDVITGCRERR
jgi:hypothetical protein